jgi:SAM-dependent methyltransferase
MMFCVMSSPARRALARHVDGHGLELGPGHEPFPLPEGVVVRYVDRWSPTENEALFPELDQPSFPAPGLQADLDVDRLGMLEDGSVDFVIASHVLEHLADPIGMVDEIHRVLRLGGVALVLLPDRRVTFDAGRLPTPVDHLVAEHNAGVKVVSDDHIREFVAATEAGREPSEAEIELHRRRSVHVHCWSEEEFVPVLRYGMDALGHRWRFVDGLRTGAPGSVGIEFGFVLAKSGAGGEGARRFLADWRAWFDVAPVEARPCRETTDVEARLRAVEKSTSWRLTGPLRGIASRFRRH